LELANGIARKPISYKMISSIKLWFPKSLFQINDTLDDDILLRQVGGMNAWLDECVGWMSHSTYVNPLLPQAK